VIKDRARDPADGACAVVANRGNDEMIDHECVVSIAARLPAIKPSANVAGPASDLSTDAAESNMGPVVDPLK
jgi:hypothetical protein